ncbi:mRNA capping enzyme [Multifurca ochricompacta]|uniref:mRNA-capping enzyme subunit alpha n=1 Tax=Multifurca ochricompacta TaxID=376703 RepID=A0AAD4QP85_9AGAM|nr:mRNA capping enzyme [Multifurca ochricompacta]
MSRIPDLPGNLISKHSEQDIWLRTHVASLCGLNHDRFPGSQPVSFSTRDLERLEHENYWVCEKSDGVRVLLVILTNLETSEQIVCIVDRHNAYREISGLFFPHYEHPERPLRSTVIDAELVIDVDPRTKRETLRLLCFDCLVADNQNVMSKTLDKRYWKLKEVFFKPYTRMLRDHPRMAENRPFERVKEVNFSYSIDKVFLDIPNLQHGNDGLIYTSVSTPYVSGTDRNILKWKPPSENSIDLKLILRFPPLSGSPAQPDLHKKPVFALHIWCGGEGARVNYEPWDTMHMDDDEWESLKASGEQVDERIVEVRWDAVGEHWRMMRFRDDKPQGNHRSVVENIVQSIADGVEKDTLLARSTAIKNAWKTRHGQPMQQQPPAHRSNAPPPPPFSPAYNDQSRHLHEEDPPPLQLRYGPLSSSPWSKVSGPTVLAGMSR